MRAYLILPFLLFVLTGCASDESKSRQSGINVSRVLAGAGHSLEMGADYALRAASLEPVGSDMHSYFLGRAAVYFSGAGKYQAADSAATECAVTAKSPSHKDWCARVKSDFSRGIYFSRESANKAIEDERRSLDRSMEAQARADAEAERLIGTQGSARPSYILPGGSDVGAASRANAVPRGQSGPSAASMPDIEVAIRQARAKRSSAPASIDGCPTGIDHLAPRLPVCAANDHLVKFRELILLTDASFADDVAAGLSFRDIALRASQASRIRDEALRTNERAMLEASADGDQARRRLAALKDTPPRCDAGPQGSFGMGESAYQAYVSQYMAALAERAVSAAAACRGRARP